MGVKLDKKYAIIAFRACYRSTSRHPVVLVMILFTIWFYRSFPLLFSLLVYASPIIVSTAILLGTLLLYGHQNPPKIRKEGKPHHHEIHNPKIRDIEDTGIGEKGVRGETRENVFGKKIVGCSNVNLNDDHPRVEIDKQRRSSIDSSVSMADKKLKEEAKCEVCNHDQKTDLGGEKIVFVNRCAQFQPPQTNTAEDHKRWETGSELSESSFPTASMAGAFPMAHDLPPLLQPEVPQSTHMLHVHRIEPEVPHHAHMLHVHKIGPEVPHHAQMSNVNSYVASNHSIESDDHDDDDDHEDEDEEEEANADEKEESVATWTEDDRKNLRNLGKTEIERNQHMENLIARQKALRNMRIQAEENLVNINLDLSYSATPIASTRRNSNASTRRNSIDLPYDFNETVLESAPPIASTRSNSNAPTRRNSIDLPYDFNETVLESAPPIASTRRNSNVSIRRNSIDLPYDLNETVLESAPPIASTRRNSNASTRRNSIDLPYDFNSVMMQRINPYDLPYDPNGDNSYPIGPTFQLDALSFQPNHQFNHHHESFDVGPSTLGASRQNEGYYTFGASENVSHSDDDDVVKLHHVARDGKVCEFKASNGGETQKEKNRVGTNFESDSLSFHPNNQFNHRHESSDVGPGYYASEVRGYVSHNQVAERHGRLDEVKTSDVGEKGYQGKSSSELSSSSSFSDVSDHLDDGEEEYDYRSAVMPSTPERQIQEQQRKNVQQSPKLEHEEGRLSQRQSSSKGLTSWFGWKP